MPPQLTIALVAASWLGLTAAAGGQDAAAFALIDQPLGWGAARDACRSQFGGDLASVHSAAEQAAIGGLCATATDYGTEGSDTAANNHYKACWIGLTDGAQEGAWQWSDSTPLGYTKWWELRPPFTAKNMRPPHAVPGTQPNGLDGSGEDGAVLWYAEVDAAQGGPSWDWVDVCSADSSQTCTLRGIHTHPVVCRRGAAGTGGGGGEKGSNVMVWVGGSVVLIALLAAVGYFVVPAVLRRVGMQQPLLTIAGEASEDGGDSMAP